MIDELPNLPKDARGVAERYMGCHTFWGEVNGIGSERDREVAAQPRRLKCNRVEEDLDLIKSKYRNSPDVPRILEDAIFTELP